jgi:hypothetical protein
VLPDAAAFFYCLTRVFFCRRLLNGVKGEFGLQNRLWPSARAGGATKSASTDDAGRGAQVQEWDGRMKI